jgi:hypothetical protein
MARTRAFDYDLLEKLVQDDPAWTHASLAAALWEDNKRADPDAPPVNIRTVSSVLTRLRYQGSDIPLHTKIFDELLPPLGSVADGHAMDRTLLFLREVAKEGRGEEAKPGDEAKLRAQAIRWSHNLPLMGSIVDLDNAGVPIVRQATAAELGEDGRPAALAAWLLDGWRPPPGVVA